MPPLLLLPPDVLARIDSILGQKPPCALAKRLNVLRHASKTARHSEIAMLASVSRPTVYSCIKRYQEAGLEGMLRVKAGRGCKPKVVAKLAKLKQIQEGIPPRGKKWKLRNLAEGAGLSPASVNRLQRQQRLDVRDLRGRTGPGYQLAKQMILVGVYLDPPFRLVAVRRRQRRCKDFEPDEVALAPRLPGLDAKDLMDWETRAIANGRRYSSLTGLTGFMAEMAKLSKFSQLTRELEVCHAGAQIHERELLARFASDSVRISECSEDDWKSLFESAAKRSMAGREAAELLSHELRQLGSNLQSRLAESKSRRRPKVPWYWHFNVEGYLSQEAYKQEKAKLEAERALRRPPRFKFYRRRKKRP